MSMAPRDPITEYLDQLRAGLRVKPGEAELILAEAEDHLRETVAAGLAVGMTEREAQQAAISSFGPVRAVVRAHQTRRVLAAAVLGEVGLAAWKLAALLSLTAGVSGLAAMAISRFRTPVVVTTPSGVWIQIPAAVNHGMLAAWAVAAFGGTVLLAGYRLTRRLRRRRGSEPERSADFFPMAAASIFGGIALALIAINVSGSRVLVAPGLAIAAYLALAIGYAFRTGRVLRHRDRDMV